MESSRSDNTNTQNTSNDNIRFSLLMITKYVSFTADADFLNQDFELIGPNFFPCPSRMMIKDYFSFREESDIMRYSFSVQDTKFALIVSDIDCPDLDRSLNSLYACRIILKKYPLQYSQKIKDSVLLKCIALLKNSKLPTVQMESLFIVSFYCKSPYSVSDMPLLVPLLTKLCFVPFLPVKEEARKLRILCMTSIMHELEGSITLVLLNMFNEFLVPDLPLKPCLLVRIVSLLPIVFISDEHGLLTSGLHIFWRLPMSIVDTLTPEDLSPLCLNLCLMLKKDFVSRETLFCLSKVFELEGRTLKSIICKKIDGQLLLAFLRRHVEVNIVCSLITRVCVEKGYDVVSEEVSDLLCELCSVYEVSEDEEKLFIAGTVSVLMLYVPHSRIVFDSCVPPLILLLEVEEDVPLLSKGLRAFLKVLSSASYSSGVDERSLVTDSTIQRLLVLRDHEDTSISGVSQLIFEIHQRIHHQRIHHH